MELTYQGLELSIPMVGLIQLEDISFSAGLNQHAQVFLKVLMEEEWTIPSVHQLKNGAEITIKEGAVALFCGKILYSTVLMEAGLNYITIQAVSYTYDWGLQEVSQTFCDGDATYMDVAKAVLGDYGKASIKDCVTEGAKIPGFLLQYEEDDWTFLMRLASHFGTFLVPEFTQSHGKAYFGIPEIKNKTVLGKQEYSMDKDMENYYRFSYMEGLQSQEMTRWQVRTKKRLVLGEEVSINQVSAIITSIHYQTERGQLVKIYGANRKKGVLCPYKKNNRICGMGIPATVKERKGNSVRVHFDVDKAYEQRPKTKFFTYGIESSCFYCMPEEGSIVHIYFPTPYEQDALAVHAMRVENYVGSAPLPAAASGGGGYAQNPDYKSFSNVNGAELLLTPESISAAAEKEKTTTVLMTGDGKISVSGTKLTLTTETDLFIGKGEESPTGELTPTKDIVLRGKNEVIVSIGKDDSCGITLDMEAKIVSAFVKLEGSDHSAPSPSWEEIKTRITENDDENREEANKQTADSLAIKKKEARDMIWSGFVKVATIAGTVGLVVCTAGAATPVLLAAAAAPTLVITPGMAVTIGVTAGIGGVFAVADIAEGVHGTYQANNGDLSKSFNMLRDTVFGGNQFLYDLAKGVNDIVFGIVSGKAIFGNLAILGKGHNIVAIQVGMNVIPGAINDLLVDGKINVGNLLFNFALGAVQGVVTTKLTAIVGGKLGTLVTGCLAKDVINVGVGTVFDVGTDYLISLMCGQDFNLTESIIKNTVANLLTEMKGEPVDAVSGAYYNETIDLALPGIMAPIELKRTYLSTVKKTGSMGMGWCFLYDSHITRDGEKVHLDTITGHNLLFARKDGGWELESKGCGWFRLSYQENSRDWLLTDCKDHTICCYNVSGLLVSVEDQNKQAVLLTYQNDMLSSLTTPLGNRIDFVCRDKKIIQISDGIGRVLQYRYEGDLLVDVVHMDQGIMHYDYNGDGYLRLITDQNGQAFLMNEYDPDGRILRQGLSNGETYEMAYDPEHRKNTVYYSGLDRLETICYNQDMLPTEVINWDGSKKQFGYDGDHQRTQTTDRRGHSQYKEYDACGRVIKETMADGHETYYSYNGTDDLVRKWDNGGRESTFTYDGCHNLIKELHLAGQGRWKTILHTYDPKGRKLSTTNARGETTLYQYSSGDGEPSMVTTPTGGETLYGYDKMGRRTTIENSYGRVELGYNRSDHVTSRKDGEGNTSQYMYDRMGNLIAYYPPKAWKEKSGAWRYRYDFMDRKAETITPEDGHYRIHRNGEGDIHYAIHPNGYQAGRLGEPGTTYEYDGDHRCIREHYPDGGIGRSFYDAEGNLIKHVTPEYYKAEEDDGLGYTYEYDARGRATAIYNPEGGLEKSYTYDPYGNVVKEMDCLGHVVLYSYDALGSLIEKREGTKEEQGVVFYRVAQYRYDLQGNKTLERYGKEEVPEGAQPFSYDEVSFAYDADDRLVLVKDGYGASLRYRYDCLGNPVYEERAVEGDIYQRYYYKYNKSGWLIEKKEEVMGNGDCQWAVTSYGYDGDGNLCKTTTPNGHLILRGYDWCDRLVKERTMDKANGIDRTISYTYDKAGNLVSEREGTPGQEGTRIRYTYDWKDRLTHKEDACGGVSHYVYDKNDRLSKETDPERYQGGKGDGKGTSYQYDTRGNLCSITNAAGIKVREDKYNAQNLLSSRTDAEGEIVEYSYTAGGQLEAIASRRPKQEGRALQQYQYDARGQVAGATDGNGNRTLYVTDGWGRITKAVAADGTEEAYAYNSAGKVTEATDGNGNAVQYRYNSFGKVRETIDQEGKSEYFYYDGEQNLVLQIDRNGNKVRRCYNVDGNLVSEVAEDSSGGDRTTALYTYDARGQLSKAAKGGISYRYVYTPDGRLSEKHSGGKRLLACTYNKNGQLSSLTDVTGKTTHYTYDTLGRPQAIRDGENGGEVRYCYNRRDLLEEAQYPNGISTKYWYDVDGNLTRLVTGGTQGTWMDLEYRYDGNGNRVEKKGTMPCMTGKGSETVSTTYIYDPKNQLVQEVHQGQTIRYQYDQTGNRLERATAEGTERYVYNSKNQLTEHQGKKGKTLFTYDAQGSILKEEGSGGSTCYEYDPLNRQTLVRTPSGVTQENIYDPEGLRSSVKEGGKITSFLFYQGEAMAELDGDGQPVTRFLRGYGAEACVQGGSTYYYHKDEQSSTSIISSAGEEIENLYRYDAYGNTTGKVEGTHNRILYTGQQYDGISGQYYLRARYYNPVVGRFLQEDVYRGDGLNLYAYCKNNPVVYYDPSGYKKCGTSEGGSGAVDDIVKQGQKALDQFDIDSAYVKPKHLSTTGGNGQKFLGNTKIEAEAILKDAMKNGTVKSITDNGLTKAGNASYEIVIDAGKEIGTKGETILKIVISEDGGMLSAYPIK